MKNGSVVFAKIPLSLSLLDNLGIIHSLTFLGYILDMRQISVSLLKNEYLQGNHPGQLHPI